VGIRAIEKSLKDTYMGIFMLALISILLIITSAGDMAQQLESLFGNFAKIIFCIGLLSAAFSSLMVNSVMGGGLFADGLGLGRRMSE